MAFYCGVWLKFCYLLFEFRLDLANGGVGMGVGTDEWISHLLGAVILQM
jgi:hypothetical protein